jgi:hypothetical protein
MLSLAQVLDFLNKPIELSAPIKRWRGVYYGVSLHTTGACPRFWFSKTEGSAYVITGTQVEPPGYYGEEYQHLFDQLLLNRHPRESAATRNWRYSQYRPFTKDPFIRVMGITAGTIFQDSNYSLELTQKEDNDYVWGNNFTGYDLIHYYQWALRYIMEDPNGYFVRIPKEPFDRTTTARIEPDVWFVGSKDILFKSNDEIIFQRDGYRWLINKVAIFRYIEREDATRAKKWMLADPSGYYAHSFGRLPISVAGGVWNAQGHYDSWLDPAKAVADDFISSKSAEQLVDKEASHPYIVQAQEDCPTCQGAKQVQEDCDTCPGGVELVSCPSCHGKGYMSQNPGERLLVPQDMMDKKMVDIISPDTAINIYHKDKNNEVFTKIKEALHLNYIDEAQSSIAKDRDMETRYQFISSICDDLFDRHIQDTLRDFIAYRNVVAINGVNRPAVYDFTIVKPTQFQIKTAADLLLEYTDATAANIPAFIRVRMMEDYVDKQFGGDAVMKKKAMLIGQMDPFCTYTEADKLLLKTGGAMQDEAWQFSLRLPAILDSIIRDRTKDWFLDSQYEIVKAEVDARFKLVLFIAPPPTLPSPTAQA